MTALTCAEARDMASDMLDRDLTERQVEELQVHVAGCSTCPGLYRALVAVGASLHRLRTDERTTGDEQ